MAMSLHDFALSYASTKSSQQRFQSFRLLKQLVEILFISHRKWPRQKTSCSFQIRSETLAGIVQVLSGVISNILFQFIYLNSILLGHNQIGLPVQSGYSCYSGFSGQCGLPGLSGQYSQSGLPGQSSQCGQSGQHILSGQSGQYVMFVQSGQSGQSIQSSLLWIVQ